MTRPAKLHARLCVPARSCVCVLSMCAHVSVFKQLKNTRQTHVDRIHRTTATCRLESEKRKYVRECVCITESACVHVRVLCILRARVYVCVCVCVCVVWCGM